MHKRMKKKLKTGAIIFFFSILITCVFAGGLLWYGVNANGMQTKDGGMYLLTSAEYSDAIMNKGELQLNANSLTGTKHYQNELYQNLLKSLFPISIGFLMIIFIFFALLWSLLNYLQTKGLIKIARELKESMTETISTDEPVLIEAYANLKEKFDNRLDDFKRLSAYITHEQKNEIAILRARMELVDNHDVIEKLDDITDSIDDILTLSENTNATGLTVVDVSLICAEVFDNYRKTADNLFFDFKGEENTEIMAKTRWIYRAVANLLDNAIKYGEGKPIVLSVRAKNNSVIIKVVDHGIGIDSDKQEEIFHDRYRVNELNKDGYGIGLSLVSHVCDLCGGFITVESEQHKGSVFYMAFPQKLY